MSDARKALFLDRDGVINHNIFYKNSQEWESPRNVRDFKIIDGALEGMRLLQEAGYLLFIVSNQPSYAKGKTSLGSLEETHKHLSDSLNENKINITEAFYCFHHPNGIVPEYSFECECRKPSPYFLLRAKEKYNLVFSQSWMVGDRETDLACGKAAGVHVCGIQPDHQISNNKTISTSQRGYKSLLQAAQYILEQG